MPFDLTEEQRAIRDTACDFARARFAPGASRRVRSE
jgi:alkylation response protein AidB-like acyl-CoA dehydrogenase